jgi:hypothetical protein
MYIKKYWKILKKAKCRLHQIWHKKGSSDCLSHGGPCPPASRNFNENPTFCLSLLGSIHIRCRFFVTQVINTCTCLFCLDYLYLSIYFSIYCRMFYIAIYTLYILNPLPSSNFSLFSPDAHKFPTFLPFWSCAPQFLFWITHIFPASSSL